MKKQLFILGLCMAIIPAVRAQQKVKDGTLAGTPTLPNANAVLELESNNKGMMLPRVALTDTSLAAPLTAHVKGMVVYDTAANAATGIAPGIYYNDGTKWVRTNSGAAAVTNWQLLGNTGTNSGTNDAGSTADGNYLGTTDQQNLVLATNGIKRMIIDTTGNAVGGNGSVIHLAPQWYGFPSNNFVWGGSDTVNNDGGSVNGYSNTIFGFLNKSTAANSAIFGTQNADLNNIQDEGYNFIAGNNNLIKDSAGSGASTNAVIGSFNKVTSASQNTILGSYNTLKEFSFNNGILGIHNTINADTGYAIGVNNTVNHFRSFAIGNGATTTATGQFSANFSGGYALMGSNVGVGTATANSTLQVNGSVSTAIVIVDGNYTLTDADYTVIYTGGSTAPTFTLPDPATCKGRIYRLVNAADVGNYHHVTLSRPVKLYTGNTTTMLSLNTYMTASVNESSIANTAMIQSDGVIWWRVGL